MSSSPLKSYSPEIPYNFKKQEYERELASATVEEFLSNGEDRRSKNHHTTLKMDKDDKAEIVESSLQCTCCSCFFLKLLP